MRIRTLARAHTHTHTLSLSLSHTHTHTHTHVARLEEVRPSMPRKTQQREADSRASDVMNVLANCLNCEKRSGDAVVAGKHALRLAERARDSEAIGFALSGLGDSLDSSGQYAEAIEAYEKCVDIAMRDDNMDEVFTRMHKIAVTHADNGHPAAEIRVYEEMAQLMLARGMPAAEVAQFRRAVDERASKKSKR